MLFNQQGKMVVILALILAAAGSAFAEVYKLVHTIPWSPLNATNVDQGAIFNGTYYLSDRTNKGVHVINLSKGKENAFITGFHGVELLNGKPDTEISGPDGLLVLPNRNELYVGERNGTIRVVDLFTNTIVANISIGGPTRADEMAYDSKAGIVAATLGDNTPPQLAFISAVDRRVSGIVTFNNASGLEQPAFNPADGLFYISVPSTDANPGGEIAVVNASAMEITRTIVLQQCLPAGIVFGPDQHLFIGCSQDQILNFGVAFSLIMDVTSGNIIGNISGLSGIDQVAYDPHANLYFASAYQNLAGGAPLPQLGVVDAQTNTLLQTITTDNVTAHSVAVDPVTDQCVVPLAKYGIAVFNLTSTATSTGTTSATSSVPSTPQFTSSADRSDLSAISWLGSLFLLLTAGFIL